MTDVREANINVSGDWRMPVMGELNERAISIEEVREAVNEMKSRNAPGLDGFTVECSQKGVMAVLEWLVRQLNASFNMGVVPMDWRGACIAPYTKERVSSVNVVFQRCINLLSVVGKLHCRVLIKIVRAGTECAIGKEQCGFRQGRGCIYKVFAVRQVCEKYLANGKGRF